MTHPYPPPIATTLYATVREAGAVLFPAACHILQLSGPDTWSFLQNRTPNDVLKLQPGHGQLNAILDGKAHVQAVFSLYRDPQNDQRAWVLWQGDPDPEQFLAHLFRFRVIEQVQAETIDPSGSFALIGPAAGLWLEAALKTNGFSDEAAIVPLNAKPYAMFERTLWDCPVRLFPTRVYGQAGWVLQPSDPVTFRSSLQHFSEKLSLPGRTLTLLTEADKTRLESLEILRIEAGWPQFGIDITENTLLPETSLELETVSYSKGCYLGQETVARVRTYGAVQRGLMGLKLLNWPKTALPSNNTPCLLEDGTTVGRITSACVSPTLKTTLALAYLDKTHRVPGQRLKLTLNDVPVEAEVCSLPFFDPVSEAKKLLDQGLKQFAEGDLSQAGQARALLAQAIQLDPTLADAYEALGVMLSRDEHYEEAIRIMQRLHQLDPERVMAHTNLSIYYMKLGDKDRAEDEKARATSLGMKLAMRKKMAENSGVNAVSVDPEAERRKQEVATREKIGLFLDALQHSPEDPLGNFGLASAYLDLHEYANAIPAFEKTLAAQPKHSVAYLSLGKCYQALKQTELARAVFEKGVTVASEKGDRMPLQEMQQRLQQL